MMKLVISKYLMVNKESNLHCPNCDSGNVVNNGHILGGKQNHLCKGCGRQFVENLQNVPISQETKNLINKLLLEKLALAAIAHVTGVSKSWMQRYVHEKFKNIEQESNIEEKEKESLNIEFDKIWSYVGNKGNKVWVWLAIDQKTGEIVGVYVGSRDKEGTKGLWESLPAVYRQCAVCYSDFWTSYKEEVIPSKRNKTVDKRSRKTNRIERFNGTLRQRVSCLLRKTLSFSKKLANHIAAIWYFMHHYKSSLHV